MTRVPFDFDKKKTSLGLNKRAKVKFNDKNLIDNISDYVDLGLPSGNLWCRYNVGASSETDSGDFLTFDELKTLDLPDGMAIPSKEDIEELLRFTRKNNIKINGINCSIIKGKIDELIFPYSGYINYVGDKVAEDGLGGIRTSSYREHGTAYVMLFGGIGYMSDASPILGADDNQLGIPTRTIIKNNMIKESTINLGLNKKAKQKHEEQVEKGNVEELDTNGLLNYLASAIQEVVGKPVVPARIEDKRTKEIISWTLSWSENDFITNMVFLKFHNDHISSMIKIFTRNPKNNNFFQSKKPIDNVPLNSKGLNIILHEIKKILKINESNVNLGLNKRAKEKHSQEDSLSAFSIKPIMEKFEEELKKILPSDVEVYTMIEDGDEDEEVLYSFYWSPAFYDSIVNTVFIDFFKDGFMYKLQLFKKKEKGKFTKYPRYEYKKQNILWSRFDKLLEEIKAHTDIRSINENRTSLGLNNQAKKKFNDVDAIENIGDFVDLGLPSGNLWKKVNVGAKSEEEYGDYYSFYELYDIREKFPDCEVPDKSDFYELRCNCDLEEEEINGKRCAVFTSKHNGNSIVMPLCGYFHVVSNEYVSVSSVGYYWSSTEKYPDDTAYMFDIVTSGISHKLECSSSCLRHKKYKQGIRLIRKKVNESINLGINKHAKKIYDNEDAIDNIAVIQFEDPIIAEHFGTITYDDAARLDEEWLEKTIGSMRDDMSCIEVKTFNEFKFFTGIENIKRQLFKGFQNLESIELPNTIKNIGPSSFRLTSLKSIKIPPSVVNIFGGAFCGSFLETVEFASDKDSMLQSIGPSAFASTEIKSIRIPEGVGVIGYSAFRNCDNLQEIWLPTSLYKFGDNDYDVLIGTHQNLTIHYTYLSQGVKHEIKKCSERQQNSAF